jgi:TATA-binding protein-associated factor Taf7
MKMGRRLNAESPYAKQLKQAEVHIIEYALQMAGSLRKASILLGVSPNFLSERIRILSIVTEFRKSPGLPERRRSAIENPRKAGRPRKNPVPEPDEAVEEEAEDADLDEDVDEVEEVEEVDDEEEENENENEVEEVDDEDPEEDEDDDTEDPDDEDDVDNDEDEEEVE